MQTNLFSVIAGKLTASPGCGSFGIIRKVKRKSDGFVSA